MPVHVCESVGSVPRSGPLLRLTSSSEKHQHCILLGSFGSVGCIIFYSHFTRYISGLLQKCCWPYDSSELSYRTNHKLHTIKDNKIIVCKGLFIAYGFVSLET